ncbi:hypothetical protein CASFOL_026064 [Castilleja foliolosa]|uniref:Uncharacterized protein n=1 Tax=Castilleja foliolosa TaxID=1961234 RepID=A0ABD3CSX1_9LAMI
MRVLCCQESTVNSIECVFFFSSKFQTVTCSDERTMSDNQYEPEAGAGASTKLSAYPFQKLANQSRRKKAEIIQLQGRLRVLEEEAEMLKEALFESMKERTELKTEINQHFSTLQHYLKSKRAGLLQVLWQESNPAIVNKGLRANALAYDSTSSENEI